MKKLVADYALDIPMLKEFNLKKIVTPEVLRNAVRHLHEHFGRRLRKVCIMVGLSRTSWHYQLKPDTNEPIRKRLKEMVDERNVEYLRKIHHALRHLR